MDDRARAFLHDHRWAVLATTRRDGSPQQSMVGYAVDAEGRILVSTTSDRAKWHNARRHDRVSLTVADGRVHLVVAGPVEGIIADPERAELTADVFAALSGQERPDPDAIVALLDDQHRVVLRLAPETTHFHE